MHLQGIFILLLSLILTNVVCIQHEEHLPSAHNSKNDASPKAVINVNRANEAPAKLANNPVTNVVNNASNTNNTSAISPGDINTITDTNKGHNETKMNTSAKLPHGADDMMQSGALQRAFYVLLGGTLLLMIFLAFRMYRIQKGGNKPNVMVRKYGVLTNRRDVEMLPLPLDEDDEDDTVFEVNNRIENHS